MSVFREWRKQPKIVSAIVLYRPAFSLTPLDGLHEFLLAWNSFSASAFPSAQLGGDLAITLGPSPSEALVTWFAQRGHEWRLFYRAATPDDDQAADPAGVYVPWGYELSPGMLQPVAPCVWEHDGQRVPLPSPSGFRALPELLGDRFRFVGPGDLGEVAGRPQRIEDFEFPICLLRLQRESRPLDSQLQLERVVQQIAALEQRKTTLEWWLGQSTSRTQLWIYREDDRASFGTSWCFAQWLMETPDEQIRQFEHTRVFVPARDFGGLHLLRPRDKGSPLAASLPAPWKLLEEDAGWKRVGYDVFVEPGFACWPPPPLDNKNILKLMTQALWGPGNDGVRPPLVILRASSEREGNGGHAVVPRDSVYRFAVPAFAPLENLADINVYPLMRSAPPKPGLGHLRAILRRLGTTGHNATGEFVESVRDRLRAEFYSGTQEIAALLDEIWSGPRADMDRRREDVHAVLQDADAIGRLGERIAAWRDRLETFRGHGGKTWEQFVKEVNSLDRTLNRQE